MTAYVDIQVPLIVVAPVVPAGRAAEVIAENIDPYPTVVLLLRGPTLVGIDPLVVRSQQLRGIDPGAVET
jgi:hypothetical protein